jgi:hypothetical protein
MHKYGHNVRRIEVARYESRRFPENQGIYSSGSRKELVISFEPVKANYPRDGRNGKAIVRV